MLTADRLVFIVCAFAAGVLIGLDIGQIDYPATNYQVSQK